MKEIALLTALNYFSLYFLVYVQMRVFIVDRKVYVYNSWYIST